MWMKVLKKLLKGAFWLCIVVLFALIILGLVYMLDWPIWSFVLVAAGFVAAGLAGFWGYKAWIRRREGHFVNEIITQDEDGASKAVPSEKDRQRALRTKWQEAVEVLRHSHLKKYGNPLYVLPWYKIIGESGTGKTTAIRNAQLSSPFASPSHTAGPGSTADCDWWFFDQAIILDMAGRYSMGTDEDRTEWNSFVRLIARYRRREPINGLIVSISAENLKSRSETELRQNALTLRHRIDELMKFLGVRFPVYVLVTKCDLIEGMVPFFKGLPESRWREVLGFSYPVRGEEGIAAFFSRSFDNIISRLQTLRRELILRIPENKICSPLLFPEELARIKRPLGFFLENFFKETPYQDQPLFRGLYLTSARQEGRPFSHFLEALGVEAGKEQSSGERSAFLHDFFAKVLVSDRALLAPTSRTLSWQRLSQNLGLSIWVLVGLVLCGLLTLSFIRNVGAMRTAGREVPVELKLGADVLQNIDELDRFREALDRLDIRNRNWWTPRMGLVQSRVLGERLNDQYVKLYQDQVVWPLQDQLGRQILTVDASTARPTVAGWVDLLTRRIHLFQGCLAGDDRGELSGFISPDYEFLLKAAYGTTGQTLPAGLSEALARTELAYLYYQDEERPLRRLYHEENERLNNLLRTEGISLLWLSDWANRQTESLQPVTFSRFWGGDTKLEDKAGTSVPRAYTPRGWIEIQAFIKEISIAMEDPSTMAMYQNAFNKIYRQEYWEAWEAYLTAFPKGERLWPDRTGRRELAARLAGEESPFRQLIREIPKELVPVLDDSENQPAWATVLMRYLRLQNKEYQKLLDTKDQGVLNRIMTGGSKFFTRLKESGKGEAPIRIFRQDQLAYRYMKSCDQANNAFAHQILTPLKAFESASNAFNEGFTEFVMPIHPGLKAFWHGAKLKQTLETDPEAEAPFWGIVQGSYNYLWRFCLAEASFNLQSMWAEEILTEIQDPSKKETIETLLRPEGKAHQFVKGPAGPFVERKGRPGYHPRVLLDEKIRFAPGFFVFMNQSQADWKVLKGVYRVHIEALPTDANRGARFKPHLTRLVLQCGGKTQELLNFNQGVSANFKWNHEECQKVLLEIHVGDIRLKRSYKGKNAFPRFLNDFRKGTKKLKPEDFPAKTKLLKDYGISSITVRYRFQGHEPLTRSLRKTFRSVPEKIVAEDVYSATNVLKSGDKTMGK